MELLDFLPAFSLRGCEHTLDQSPMVLLGRAKYIAYVAETDTSAITRSLNWLSRVDCGFGFPQYRRRSETPSFLNCESKSRQV